MNCYLALPLGNTQNSTAGALEIDVSFPVPPLVLTKLEKALYLT